LTLAPFVVPYVDGLWSETGMLWWKDDVQQPPFIPTAHARVPGKRFHGTLAPVKIGNYIEMLDTINYPIEIGSVTDVVAPHFLLKRHGVGSFIMGPITAPPGRNTAMATLCQ
jgi:hypothetical protein